MNALKDGGPAFPCTSKEEYGDHGRTQEITRPGMTLRDYFIAHAPPEPPLWFIPKLPPMPELGKATYTDPVTGEKTEYESANDADNAHFDEWDFPGMKAQKEWRDSIQKETLLQWPGFWADAMLAERQKARAK